MKCMHTNSWLLFTECSFSRNGAGVLHCTTRVQRCNRSGKASRSCREFRLLPVCTCISSVYLWWTRSCSVVSGTKTVWGTNMVIAFIRTTDHLSPHSITRERTQTARKWKPIIFFCFCLQTCFNFSAQRELHNSLSPSLFLSPKPYIPMHCSKPSLVCPACSLRSPPTITCDLSYFII